ncbi:hypothetical protein TVAG_063010 [Trichomonas vaginalis G3]|uniref:Raptor N-terminal CASPase-like domain-containing protein n=1 Tax=Trichomonas vaginalis (strain ATCC PRA-98 / G3) TaxID=412133 RepID=A2DLR3_TRIV3|nr:TOR signaling [Trichomonas vaginalis G3]EAY18696.1 hypothetical protein TVAG_063010 [Trichomonas vaginalis G3]KAI5522595.1 TOR signaling [Trichomonas vaginalis G3]|eukprot:XP_001579682.1 hypothetical protein [Trichomonas vaginalis G3]
MIDPSDIGERSSEGYSDGETSDDLAVKYPSATGSYDTPKSISLLPQQCLYDLINKVDVSVAENSKLTNLAHTTDQDYYIDQLNKPFLYINSAMIEPIQSVILITTKTYQFSENVSEYLKDTPIIFGWQNIYQMQASDISSNIQTCYRSLYLHLRQHLVFSYVIGLSQTKIDTIIQLRKNCPRGRQMFHFIGYQFPKITNRGISYYPISSTNILSFESLFNIISPPSCFLFDCDNAGIVIPIFEEASKHFVTPSARKTDGNQASDWFCFCATSPGEELPIIPYLPKDFLSQCILNPIPLVILCHILQNYRTSFPTENFPISILNDILLNSQNGEIERNKISLVLLAVADAIASDNLQPFMFKQMFRRDRTTSRMFEHFIVAQHLLQPYGIHPQSHPRLPNLSTHQLWSTLESELSIWVSSKISGRPNIEFDFFNRVLTSFENTMDNGYISQVLLALMCHAPFSGFDGAKRSVILLSQLAARSQSNRNMLSKISIFHAFFARLVSNLSAEELHSISYIVVSLLQCDPNSVFDIRHDLDISALPNALFDRNVNCQTRSLIAAILAAVIDTVKAVEAFCSTAEFFDSLTQEIPIASPQLQLWLLILVKRVFGSFPAISGSFTPSGAHLQIAACLNHKSPEVRAAAIASLTAFIGERGPATALIYLASPLLFDMSFVVRYEFAQFLSRFFELQNLDLSLLEKIQNERNSKNSKNTKNTKTENFPENSEQKIENSEKNENEEEDLTINGIIDKIVGSHVSLERTSDSFIDFVHKCDDINNSEKSDEYLVKAITLYSDILEKDPHPSVKQAGSRLKKAVFEGGEISDGDTDALFNISLRQLVNSGQYKVSEEINEEKPFTFTPFHSNDVPACSAHELLVAKLTDMIPYHVIFEQTKYSLAVASPAKSIIRLDEGLHQFGRLSCTDAAITDLRTTEWDDVPRIIIGSSDGCVNVWEGNHHECSLTFKATTCSANESTYQLVSPARQKHKFATSNFNGGVVLWDADYSQFIGEWKGDKAKMTSLEIAARDDTTVISGYENGLLSVIDTRQPHLFSVSSPNYNLGGIVKIKSSFSSDVIINTMSHTGVYSAWDARMWEPVHYAQINTFVDECDIHPCYSIAILTPNNGNTMIVSSSGKVLCTLPNLKNVSSVAMHPTLPIFACSTQSGEIVSYQLAFSYN